MTKCERCGTDDPNVPGGDNISTHEVIRVSDPELPGPMRVSLGFWRETPGDGEYALCVICKTKVLMDVCTRLIHG
jgi:hypothetical protein